MPVQTCALSIWTVREIVETLSDASVETVGEGWVVFSWGVD